MTNLITTHQRDTIFEIILNRPDKRNALNREMMDALAVAIERAEKLPGIRAVILRGEGRGFSAGIDVTDFMTAAERFGESWRDNLFPLTAYYQGIVNKFEACSLPVVVLIHGFCLGMGLELALAADFRIVAEGAKIGLPESLLGLIPDVGGTTRLARLVGPARAKEYIMTGRSMDLGDAERWGVVNHIVPADDLLARGDALADELAKAAPLAVHYAKRVINGLTDVERGFQLEGWAQSVLVRSEDFANGVQAVLTKQAPQWQGK
ncbi:MAG: enoyl-CoA hydratase/isomerase family protein [Anaerolineaceae bacterium]|nr:enoyl-CoA hydratase/isomerase family protein [Anaerolineaceae bacterium]